jgi:N6-L-threonylcarbamoyladenine synthase
LRVLGIETSCDETAAAVIEDDWQLLSNVVATQAELNAVFGGVVPEIASRRHVELILRVIEEGLSRAGVAIDAIDGVAVTNRPGLVGSLLVGVSAAKTLAYARRLPIVGVHHLEGHVFANFLAERAALAPAVALIASGGHTELYFVHDLHDYRLMGTRLDDAAGEAFDKGARAMGLPQPGGPAIDRLARDGDPARVPFPRAVTQNRFDFSFSGLKTALLRFMEADTGRTPIADVAASYQQAIVDVLVEHAVAAAEAAGVETLLAGGGVAANSSLQRELKAAGEKRGLRVSFPPLNLCTDNAAMIAAVGHSLLQRDEVDGLDLEPKAREPLTTVKWGEPFVT